MLFFMYTHSSTSPLLLFSVSTPHMNYKP